ncbi:hypothetical protein [Rosenbergiella metrosideri]|uniref:hypothetical protein n=1 Tax=Rosenbergiella metrosideri TaxID=2921185 RepID=UPI003BAB5006
MGAPRGIEANNTSRVRVPRITDEAGRMSENITSIPKMLNQNKHNYSEVARQLNVHRYTVRRLEDDKDCHHHIVVAGRLMTETRAAK